MLAKAKSFYIRFRYPIFGIGTLLVLLFPFLFPQESVLTIAVRVLIYMILASGFNIANGYI